jgi:WD40 repeat protein
MQPRTWHGLGLVLLGTGCLGLLPLSLSAQEPKLRATFKGHTFVVSSLAFSPDGKTLASGSNDRTIKLWAVETGKKEK